MLNPRLAARYAKSLIDLAIEKGQLDEMYKDMQGLQSVCKNSHEFVLLMRSPVVKADIKLNVVQALFGGKINPVSEAFIQLIIRKGREFFLPEIADAFIGQYKKHNKINEVLLTTAEPLDEQTFTQLKLKIEQQFQGMHIDLTTKVNPDLIGGFIVEANNNLFDASIIRDLNDIRKQFLKNEFIAEIR
jgi:F-type H+-transporting ATPase subunit delta